MVTWELGSEGTNQPEVRAKEDREHPAERYPRAQMRLEAMLAFEMKEEAPGSGGGLSGRRKGSNQGPGAGSGELAESGGQREGWWWQDLGLWPH